MPSASPSSSSSAVPLDPASKRKRSSSSTSHGSHRTKHSSTSSKNRGSESEADSVASASSSATSASSSSAKKRKSKKREDDKAGRVSSSSSTSASSFPSTSKTIRPPYLSQLPLSSAFELQYPLLNLSIAPVHASKPMTALTELMDTLVMRFVPPLNGILICHGQAFFMVDHAPVPNKNTSSLHDQGASTQIDQLWTGVGPSALIGADAAFATSKVAVECCVWRPKVGMKIEGTITLSTPSHVSLLIHATFNASISSEHMTDYEFIEDSTPPPTDDDDGGKGWSEAAAGGDGGGGGHGQPHQEHGYWSHKITRQRLGASTGGRVQFAIISLTISPPSLSLSGSLLERPFDLPPHRLMSSTTAAAAGGIDAPWNITSHEGMASVDREAIKKATRRVRWEEDEEDEDEDEGEGEGDGHRLGGVNDSILTARQNRSKIAVGKHVTF